MNCWYLFDKQFTDFDNQLNKLCNRNVLTVSTGYHIYHISFKKEEINKNIIYNCG